MVYMFHSLIRLMVNFKMFRIFLKPIGQMLRICNGNKSKEGEVMEWNRMWKRTQMLQRKGSRLYLE